MFLFELVRFGIGIVAVEVERIYLLIGLRLIEVELVDLSEKLFHFYKKIVTALIGLAIFEFGQELPEIVHLLLVLLI